LCQKHNEIWDRPALVPVVITVPMSAFESIPIALAGGPSTGPSALADKLNARELEILRLLAAGHTVKSIAVRLSRSEASTITKSISKHSPLASSKKLAKANKLGKSKKVRKSKKLHKK
jgi:hypothetical protein